MKQRKTKQKIKKEIERENTITKQNERNDKKRC